MSPEQNAYQNTLLLLIVITAVAVDVSIPILPYITDHFEISRDQAPLIISTFLAGYGISMIPVGLLSDRYGRLPVTYIGIIIYIVAGAVISFAPNFEMVLWGRFIQGIGGGVGPVNARAIARDLVGGKQLAKLISSLTAALFLAPIFAPIIGNQLYLLFNWQVAFLVPPLLGIILLICIWLTAYETLIIQKDQLSIKKQFFNSMKILLASRQSIWAMLIITTTFAGYQIILANVSLLMTEIYDIEINKVGIIFGFTAILMVLATIFNKKKSESSSPVKLLGYGILMSFIAIIGFIFCYFSSTLSFKFAWTFFAFYITATGLIMANTNTIALAPLSQIAGFASSVFGASMILGASIATALAARFYNETLISITLGIIICTFFTTLIFIVGLLLQRRDKKSNQSL